MDGASRDKTELARQIAVAIVEGFDRHYRLFRETSARAKARFEQAEWAEVQRAVSSRIRFYYERVGECVERLHGEFAAETLDAAPVPQLKVA